MMGHPLNQITFEQQASELQDERYRNLEQDLDQRPMDEDFKRVMVSVTVSCLFLLSHGPEPTTYLLPGAPILRTNLLLTRSIRDTLFLGQVFAQDISKKVFCFLTIWFPIT